MKATDGKTVRKPSHSLGGARRPHPTKRGPGRMHAAIAHGRSGPKPVGEPGAFGKGLRAVITRNQLNALNESRKK